MSPDFSEHQLSLLSAIRVLFLSFSRAKASQSSPHPQQPQLRCHMQPVLEGLGLLDGVNFPESSVSLWATFKTECSQVNLMMLENNQESHVFQILVDFSQPAALLQPLSLA